MAKKIQLFGKILSLLFLGLISLLPLAASAAETPTMAIEEAKFAIDQARKAGAEQRAYDDLSAAKSWLSRAEKEYAETKSFFSRAKKMVSTDKAKEEEIIHLATMAKIKAMTAEAKSRKAGALTELQDVQKELSDYQSALAIFKQKLAEGEKAKEAQAKAEAERKELKEAKRKAAEMEAQKRKELEEAQKKAAEIEALKQKELQEARLKEAQRAGEREKELGEAKLKAERLAMQHTKEEAEMKAREEQLAAEKQKLAALQKKAEALEREKAMLAEANKIPNVTVKSADKEMVITILAIHLFTPANDLKSSGKTILDRLGKFLKSYSNNQVVVRGHTDSVGKETTNQAISEKRSQRVREYLVAYQDIPSTRITAIGLGPSQPVASNSTEAGRALNRRVEITIIPKD